MLGRRAETAAGCISATLKAGCLTSRPAFLRFAYFSLRNFYFLTYPLAPECDKGVIVIDKDSTFSDLMGDWLHHIFPYLSTVLLACWGGAVSYIQHLQKGRRKMNWREFLFDLIISSFSGVLTHFLCEMVGIDGARAAMLVAISGHMGTRAIAGFEHLRDRLFGVNDQSKF